MTTNPEMRETTCQVEQIQIRGERNLKGSIKLKGMNFLMLLIS